jgi:hypothetical protein
MGDELRSPTFDDGQIEIAVRDDGIAIDMTYEGLERLIRLLVRLKMQCKRTGVNEHLHLEDYELLTSRSPPCVVAVFIPRDRKDGVEATLRRPRRRTRWMVCWRSLFDRTFCNFSPLGGGV